MPTATTKPTTAAPSGQSTGGGYTVLARRYRSRDFDELVGQDTISQTLCNAIEAGRTAHAYLFCGTRGVGKTSMARIFAKAINVTMAAEPPSEADAVSAAILRGDDLDVIEIDGASNRGINEAKELIAGAGLSPARCRYKIYIIDEVHMLTKEAFNALLKTMEEPPEHIKFILCTTEPQKVPATIQSRCQRFDFRAIATTKICEQLKHVLAEEGIEADEDLVRRIAALGNGSMRDALSLLDRVIAGGETKISMERAEQLLGLPDQARARAVVEAIAGRDPATALIATAEIIAGGATVDQAMEMIVEQWRDLLLIRTCGAETELVDRSDEARQELAVLAGHFDIATIVYLIALTDATARNARGSVTGRALLDAAVVRMCLSDQVADVAALLKSGGQKKNEPLTPPRARLPASAPTPVPVPVSVPVPVPVPVSVSTPAPPVPVPVPVSTSAPADLWPAVERHARQSPRDASKLSGFTFVRYDDRVVYLAAEAGRASAGFLAAQAEPIADLIKRATGATVRVSIDVASVPAAKPVANSPAVHEAREIPAVKHAIEIFDAIVTDVQPWSQDAASETQTTTDGAA